MSLINQVLSELEQRGVHPAPNQTLVRAVPIRAYERWLLPVAVAAVITLVLLLALWVWRVKTDDRAAQLAAASAVPAAPVLAVPDVIPASSEEPASKLSYELSVLPMPESLRAGSADEPPPPTKEAVLARVEPKPKAEVRPKTEASSKTASQPKLAASGVAEGKPAPVRTEDAKSVAVSLPAAAEPPIKLVSSKQQADAEYRKALLLQQQGHVAEALAGYEMTLKLNPKQDAARLSYAALLVESKRGADAERVLQEGMRNYPFHLGFSMALARAQVERGRLEQALETMQKDLPHADTKADYQAFYAALLQRQGRHKEAVSHYQIAVDLSPNNGVWQMGYGISLQEVFRIEDAKAAYQKALATRSLSPELAAFVEQKLKGF